MKMKITHSCAAFLILLLSCFHLSLKAKDPVKKITIVLPAKNHDRLDYGEQNLQQALQQAGYIITTQQGGKTVAGNVIFIGLLQDAVIKTALLKQTSAIKTPGKEGFIINSANNKTIIGGADNSGALYGCLELADRI